MPRGGVNRHIQKFPHNLKVKCQWQSEVLIVWARTSGGQKFRRKQPEVPTPTRIALQVLKQTLSAKMKCWVAPLTLEGHHFVDQVQTLRGELGRKTNQQEQI